MTLALLTVAPPEEVEVPELPELELLDVELPELLDVELLVLPDELVPELDERLLLGVALVPPPPPPQPKMVSDVPANNRITLEANLSIAISFCPVLHARLAPSDAPGEHRHAEIIPRYPQQHFLSSVGDARDEIVGGE